MSTGVKVTGSAMCESHCFIITDYIIFNYINVINLNKKLYMADSLLLKVEFNKIFVNLICLYVFHFLDKINKFYRWICFVFFKLPNFAVLVGDFNLDLMYINPVTQQYTAMLGSLVFSQFIDCPTHSKTCLDRYFTDPFCAYVYEEQLLALFKTY